ncbi:HAMP domain-containing sensor histidine kinase [uncultured Subdoligranulum sp.]|uniref:sensor histidine kinase n=1 Tax=uncultured Subdoligranulum sp. TaxID=512298 RepID=UPI0032092DBE
MLPNVFDQLYQCDPSRTTPGNGLGLSITKELVVAMGGTIQAQSSPDHETTFTICFPKAKALP